MPQHRALQISEIILEIFRYVSDTSPSRTADLAALARCCRSFKDQALDQLWSEMDDVEALLSLIPPLSESYHPRGSHTVRCYKLDRHMTPCDWVRFDHYARRIFSLTYKPLYDSGNICCAEVFFHLRREKNASLLPRLRTLVWHPPKEIPFTGRRFLEALSVCPSSLTKLHISGGGRYPEDGGWRDDPLFNATLEKLPIFFPQLQSFEASGDLPRCHFDFAGLLLDLRHFDNNHIFSAASTILPEGLRSLSRLPRLETLSLHDVDMDAILLSPAPVGFPSLTRLDICVIGITEFLYILSLLSPEPLKEIFIEDFSANTHTWISAFPHLSPFTSLQTINIVASISSSYEDGDHSIDSCMSILGPLLVLHQLSDVEIKSGGHLQTILLWTDENVRQVACAWPYLRLLKLHFPSVGPSIKSLGFFAEFCPRLRCASISVTLSDPGDLATCQSTHQSNHPLHWLMFGTTVNPPDPPVLAEYLHRLFPSLDALHGMDYFNDVEYTEEVLRLLRLRQLERKMCLGAVATVCVSPLHVPSFAHCGRCRVCLPAPLKCPPNTCHLQRHGSAMRDFRS
ncbi:hypothetical protein JAAARDRAFT_478453 [Jaapia argillacea MUCL 33604]|uniref:F-box domain-containing protein n=1 Tax=Jaapia argillacea MUCL 33604 TaxID=933084 RepID=A0A067PQC4_9AGAM|nr:hypothetical protein JAAARDRAFT_478453 [Jaapia argillacea MUCL 33604]